MSTTWTKLGSRSVKSVSTTGTETLTQPVQASTTVAFVSAVAGNTVTLHGSTFTAIANGATPANLYEFAVGTGGSADSDTGDAFAASVNATTDVHGCTATNAAGTVTVKAVEYGTGPNSWAVTKVGDPITLGAATLGGGVDIVGLPLADVGVVSVKAECVITTATIAGGALTCYVLNDRTKKYVRYPDGDLAPGAAFLGYAWALPVSISASYIAWVLTGVTISAGNVAIYLDAFEADTRPTSGRAL